VACVTVGRTRGPVRRFYRRLGLRPAGPLRFALVDLADRLRLPRPSHVLIAQAIEPGLIVRKFGTRGRISTMRAEVGHKISRLKPGTDRACCEARDRQKEPVPTVRRLS